MSRLWRAAILVALLAAAGDAGAATGPPLAGLVVPRGALGSLARGLQVSLISGTVSNARAATDSYDLSATAASVTKAGRVSGYRLIYRDPGYAALRRGAGVIDLGTSLDSFKTARQAQAYEAKWLHDLQRARGKNLQGVVLERVARFRVGGLGGRALGLRLTERYGSKQIYSTYVDFQSGRLLCEAAIRRADPAPASAQTVAIARTLAARIARYEHGRLKPAPVRLPRPLGRSRPGPHAPDLRTMVLRRQDLPASVVIDQGYAPDDEAVGSYYREFRFDPQSGLLLLRSSAALERTAREAAGRMLLLRSILTGPEAAETLADLVFAAAKAPKLEGVRRALGVGEESFAVAASFGADSRRLEAVLVHVRRGRVLGTMIVVGQPKASGLSDAGIAAYARALDRAIQHSLGEKPKLVA